MNLDWRKGVETRNARVGGSAGELLEATAERNPIELFQQWFEAALAAGGILPNAMTLATATPEGAPSARMVLLKDFDQAGFVFFTNYESRKAQELAANPRAALLFFWPELDRQVRIEGRVKQVSGEESDQYFQSRPRGSQLGALVSPQSQIIPGRDFLELRVRQHEEQNPGRPIARPTHWGGYRLTPDSVEFWQSQPDRLHDRLLYRRDGDRWTIVRLAP